MLNALQFGTTCGFPVRLGNPAGGLLCPVWLCGVAGWCDCSACVAGLLFRKGGLPRWLPVGTVKSFGEPHSVIAWLGRCDLTGDVVM